ncbi:MAG: AAA family ATPase [Thermoplasmata archaeon]|nr:MAG: AAA family ATPase [Thermoplasmata archaeon]
MVKLLKTYIRGFDEEIGGGIPLGHVVLVTGSPGTMKSTLAYNILYNAVKRDKMSSLYISLEQSSRSLLFQMVRCGMKETFGDDLLIVDLAKIRKQLDEARDKPWLEILRKHIQYIIAKNRYQIIVIDSLPVLEILTRMENKRTQFFHFFEWLRDLKLTSFIITEISDDPTILRDEEFLADGVIYLSMKQVGEIDIHRRIRCIKMRGMDHSTSQFTLEFKKNEFRVTRAI